MAKEDFYQVSSNFEAMQGIWSSILCTSIFRQICPHCNASPLLCMINISSSSLNKSGLHYSRILYCRIVSILKLKILIAFERKKPPITNSESKLKTQVEFEVHAQSLLTLLVGNLTGEVNIFTKSLFTVTNVLYFYIYKTMCYSCSIYKIKIRIFYRFL